MAKKKKFFEIKLPIINQTADLFAEAEEELVGRTIKIDLTRKLRGKSLEAVFKIKKYGDKTLAQIKRIHLLGYYIRRMLRKSASYIEDSFSVQCKDAKLKIKPFLIARKKVSRAVRKALRNKAKEEIEKTVKEKKYEDIFSEIIANSFQRTLSLKLKKTYPLALCEIRDIFVESEEERPEKKEVKIKEEKVE